ncbi:major capsid protein [Blackfly microvirus SF02]|uniref:Major capsid protein n=1 Tax=Blackfly microvirus SF02 TaxID=2576452 RepID=A0A4V1F5F7_9VIRU|nr:major capsid protein [Blackfly microvirus SF02]
MARMPSSVGASHNFAQVPKAEIPRSSFDRSNSHKTSFDAGYLIPVFHDEVIPGDTCNLNMTGFCRLSTPLRPFMDNVFLNSFFFFVPMRLLWTNAYKFFGGQDNPGDSTSFTIPQIVAPAGGYTEQSLYDYFELPTKVAGFTHSALYLRAYNLIWNEWFRDQNLQTSLPKNMGDGPDPVSHYWLQFRGKRHDYFTGSLPWPQKGPGVTIPLGSTAPIKGLRIGSNSTAATNPAVSLIGVSSIYDQAAGPPPGWIANSGTQSLYVEAQSAAIPSAANRPQIFADLSAATASTVNQLRQAFQLQKLQERDARGGTRYTEIVQAHFNVTSPDARLQRPEYLGGGQGMVNVHQVAQTSATVAGQTPQASLAAYGTSTVTGHGFSKSFTEHGIIIGLISVRADINYQQGLNRRWSRSTKYDYYWPALSMIGEQAVLNQEIYCQGTAGGTADAAVFGYNERYAEYRYKPSVVTGKLRSNSATPLDTWHLAQNFASLPALNASFIVDNPPIARVVAVPSEPNFIGDFWFATRWARPMPVYGVPGLIDHF